MSNTRLKSSFSIERAHRAQIALSKRLIFEDQIPETIRFVAGVDVAYTDKFSIAAVAVLDYNTLEMKETKVSVSKTSFPYIPTLLSFRELPAAAKCIRKLQTVPDIFLVDGHGYAHPYRCGFACHLGLYLKKPTIGVAKKILAGTVMEEVEGKADLLVDHDEIIGAEVRKQPSTKPVYVSVGNMLSLETAIRVVTHCIDLKSIPKPILLAHNIANEKKREINKSTRNTRSAQ